MIQGFTESNITAFLSTEDNRIDTAANISKIRFIVKLINDMNGDVEYCYPSLSKGILPRYTQMIFTYNVAPDRYAGTIKLLPAGHWKYEVYEVVWIETPVVAFGTAPATETDVLPVANTNGIVKGLVTKGILNLTAKEGTGQVEYNQHESPDGANYVWYGEDIDVWNPADESSMVAWYKNKAGITLDDSSNVSEWLDSSTNSFNMTQATLAARPSYTASTGGLIFNNTGVTDFLQSVGLFPITTQFTIAFKIKSTIAADGIILSGTSDTSRVEVTGCCSLTIFGSTGSGKLLTTTSGTILDAYIIITRDATNKIELIFNGITQNNNTLTTNLRLNKIAENFNGSIFEIMVFDSTSPALNDLINERLSNL